MPNANLSPDAAMADVLSQNLEAAEQIKAAANELEVVHAVLSTQIPNAAATATVEDDLQAAVARTGEIEEQLSETAQALDQSNALLRDLAAQSDKHAG